jgi:predicted pyridoxine 5'-phosphate oxidase superfamily flavin-nucleotide-binding protein
MIFIATSAADGMCDVSPKGDPAGFVRVLDARTLAVRERPGNRRAGAQIVHALERTDEPLAEIERHYGPSYADALY